MWDYGIVVGRSLGPTRGDVMVFTHQRVKQKRYLYTRECDV